MDGQSYALLKAGDWVNIRKAEEKIQLVRTRPTQFFQLVRDKLAEWSR